jgi:hypothetical protein
VDQLETCPGCGLLLPPEPGTLGHAYVGVLPAPSTKLPGLSGISLPGEDEIRSEWHRAVLAAAAEEDYAAMVTDWRVTNLLASRFWP